MQNPTIPKKDDSKKDDSKKDSKSDSDKDKDKNKDDKDKSKPEEPVKVTIDFDGISQRILALPVADKELRRTRCWKSR